MSDSSRPHGQQSTRLLHPWDFPGKSTGVGCHCLLRIITLRKTKFKEKILNAAREKQQITHKGIPIRITADLSIETLQTRREWQDTLKVMKEKNLQLRLLYPASISFKYGGEIKSFTDKQSGENSAPPNQLFNKY